VEEHRAAGVDERAQVRELVGREGVAGRRHHQRVDGRRVRRDAAAGFDGVAVFLRVRLEDAGRGEVVVLAVGLVPADRPRSADLGVPDVEQQFLVVERVDVVQCAVVDQRGADAHDVAVDGRQRNGSIFGVRDGVTAAVGVLVCRGRFSPHGDHGVVSQRGLRLVEEARRRAELRLVQSYLIGQPLPLGGTLGIRGGRGLGGVYAQDSNRLDQPVRELHVDRVAVGHIDHVDGVGLAGVDLARDSLSRREQRGERFGVEVGRRDGEVSPGVVGVVEHLVVVEPETGPERRRHGVARRRRVVIAEVRLAQQEHRAAVGDERGQRVEQAVAERRVTSRRRNDDSVGARKIRLQIARRLDGVAVVLGVRLERGERREVVVLTVALVPQHRPRAAEFRVPEVEEELLVPVAEVGVVLRDGVAQPDDVAVDGDQRNRRPVRIARRVAVAVLVGIVRRRLAPHRHQRVVSQRITGRVQKTGSRVEYQTVDSFGRPCVGRSPQ